MKVNIVKMQGISIGIQKLQSTQPSSWACKENLLTSSDSQPSSVYHTRSKRHHSPVGPHQSFLTSNHGQLEVSRYNLFPPPPGLSTSFHHSKPDLTSMELYEDEFSDNYQDSCVPVNITTTALAPLNRQKLQRPISTSHLFAQKEVSSLHPGSFPFGLGTMPSNSSPLPPLQWAHSGDLWRQMREKDVTKSTPEVDVQIRHPGILPTMRVILLDWMLEVSSWCVCIWDVISLSSRVCFYFAV